MWRIKNTLKSAIACVGVALFSVGLAYENSVNYSAVSLAFFKPLSRSFHHDKLLFFHIIQQYINLFAAIVVAIFIAWKKELVYRDVKQGSNEIKFVKPWVLPPVLYIHNRAWRKVYQLGKIFLCPPFASRSFFIAIPNGLKSSFLSSWYILISSYIIVHFG